MEFSETSVQSQLDLSNKNPFPNENIDPKIKGSDKFGLKVAKAIYYQSRYTDALTQRSVRIKDNRDYASGRQDTAKYKKILDPEIENAGNTSWLNISWAISSPAQKFVSLLVGDMINQEYKNQFNAVDAKARSRREQARDEYIGKMVRAKDNAEFEKEMGVKLESDEGFIPKDIEELDMYMDMSWKESIEIAMEEIVDWTFYDNDFERLKPRIIHDLVENNIGALRLYWDENKNIRLRYVDIAGLVTSYSGDPYYNDTEYEGELMKITIRELRNLSNGKLTDKELFKIAEMFAGKLGNKTWDFTYGYDAYDWGNTAMSFDDYRIEVLDFVYYTTDINTYGQTIRDNGRVYFEKRGINYTKPEKSRHKEEVIQKKVEQSYCGLWVVGTDYMALYGREKNITRPKKEGRPSPKILHKFLIVEPNKRYGSSNSFIDIIRPNIDEIQIFVLKIRHFVAESVPPGMAIDWHSLNSIHTDGQGDWHPLKQMKLFKQTGILLFDRSGDDGTLENGKPFEFLQNGLGDGLRPFFDGINFQLQQIASNTGLNDAKDGTRPDKDALVGIQKLQIIASNNITRELYTAFSKGLFERAGTVISRMVQDKIQFGGGLGQYIDIIGRGGVQALTFIPEDLALADLGIKTEALPTGEELQDILNAIQAAVENKEIRYEDAAEIKSMSPKKATKFLRFRKKKYKEEEMAELTEREAITTQREQASVAASAEKEKIKLAAEAESKKIVLAEEYRLKSEFEKLQAANLIALEKVKTEGRLQEIKLAAETDLDRSKSENPLVPQPKVFPTIK